MPRQPMASREPCTRCRQYLWQHPRCWRCDRFVWCTAAATDSGHVVHARACLTPVPTLVDMADGDVLAVVEGPLSPLTPKPTDYLRGALSRQMGDDKSPESWNGQVTEAHQMLVNVLVDRGWMREDACHAATACRRAIRAELREEARCS